MSQDYNATINLPKTEFPMRAGLPKREPVMLEEWYEKDLYNKILEKNEGKPQFILHDGPPFSNGNIHMGTSLNKVIKDIIVRYKNMSGYRAPYVPGWDNHGMPIESAIIKQNKLDRKSMSISEFRNACQKFAGNFVDVQREQFKRLGVLGDWEHPYLTMDSGFEALEIKVFGEMYAKGYIYKGLKPVYWCPHDETSLAEAEIEYEDADSHSVYVKFRVLDDKGKLSGISELNNTYFVIWTTTPWTLPGNLAISLNADFDYVLLKVSAGETYIVAEKLAESVIKECKLDGCQILSKFKGKDFELMSAQHPLYERESVVILGDHVTLEAGTGCVHTAPGHGMEDFVVCKTYDDAGLTSIGAIVPVNSRGILTAEAGKFEGMFYEKSNIAIIDELKICGALLSSTKIKHQYPHCWRCKNPIIYRATEQWFCSVDGFKDRALEVCKDVIWSPDWGYERMSAMIKDRADWCISRQRSWGLPIPVFYCDSCAKPVCTEETIEQISEVFAEKGSSAWFDMEVSELLPSDFSCPHCGGRHFTKETDTLDCWFDSGSTHIASLMRNNPGEWPADVYLEGSDQFRGWFQSSLLTAVALKDMAPYKMVLTSGWILDAEGRSMHKSLGNVIPPEDIINKYGADILRLWVASSDFRVDIKVSDNQFKQLSEIYLKIRNTARFILGNLDGFNPDNPVAFNEMTELDRWALVRLGELISKVIKSYENYEYHPIFHAVHNFCVIDMSNFYLDIVKDRLYCEEKEGVLRRSAQTVIYTILDALVRILAPILSFTAEEIWQVMPHSDDCDTGSIMFNSIAKPSAEWVFDSATTQKWDDLLLLRADVNKALELARSEKLVGKALDAEVTLFFDDDTTINGFSESDLKTLFIVSDLKVVKGSGDGHKGEYKGVTVKVVQSAFPKCERCWAHDEHVSSEGLCPRCSAVVKR